MLLYCGERRNGIVRELGEGEELQRFCTTFVSESLQHLNLSFFSGRRHSCVCMR
jgi:hypothetical protein